MNTATAQAPQAAHHRTIKLPAIGIALPHLGGGFWGLQAAKPGSGPDYPLIVPPGPEFEVRDVAWGAYGEDIPGAACYWDGLANTNAMLASGHKHPVLDQLVALRESTGMNDLYLPSLREAKTLFAAGCDAFDKDRWYWTSTQYSRNSAFTQTFDYGRTRADSKVWEHGCARFVRRFLIQSLNP